MLSKKSKIEQLPKSRESRFLAAAASASLCRTRTKLCGRLLVIRRGPSHRRARDAPAALKNFFHPPEKPFSTVSVTFRPKRTRYRRVPIGLVLLHELTFCTLRPVGKAGVLAVRSS
jgi:hypothetical protein